MQILDMTAAVTGKIYSGPLPDIEKGVKIETAYGTGCCVDYSTTDYSFAVISSVTSQNALND